ncbi:NAD(P)/FAD-dependent oxidoreductase [Paraglaciecola arctica]|uniref:NAD(P)/FAD-dependent oxidoreductase n=1 Tax=Paraglaciecola arctica TaxID=1128911 RepID=UPI001C06F528|nr:FAD-dependent oxidoreductase [Paraglaciecola arctica]MBU3005338.1 FAD-dependent oxidoreductase [Paraglaciecola arctica]
MSDMQTLNGNCIIIGASHAGVNAAFALRKEGWQGAITIFDTDPTLPYHRPPLSKAYLTSDDGIEKNLLKAEQSYEKNNISLSLGIKITLIDRQKQLIHTEDGELHNYSKLIIATGARPFIPPIKGIDSAHQLYPLRTAEDVNHIRQAMLNSDSQRVVIIGGGYIGLETAASLKKMGANVTVLERESRILARVTAPLMSDYFQQLHHEHGVEVFTAKDVISIETKDDSNTVICADGSQYPADIIIVGVGIRVNTELALEAGLDIENGIKVDNAARTNDNDIYAIGDCSFHHNPHYNRLIRLESVQNAVDQAKVAAASICGKDVTYDTLPWFWSDQYDVKLQMVGLSSGYNKVILRKETDDEGKFSVWYFDHDRLLSVDTINHAKAYVVGTKLIKSGAVINQSKLADSRIALHPDNLI